MNAPFNRAHSRARLATAAASLLALGCAGRATSTDSRVRIDAVGALNGATVELESEGGIAALAINYQARHDDRAYAYTVRHICSTSCGAAVDSAAGALAPNAADSLFSIIAAASPLDFKADYGATVGGADMLTYTLHVTFEGQTKVARADDGTMPDGMRRIVDAVRGIISAARK